MALCLLIDHSINDLKLQQMNNYAIIIMRNLMKSLIKKVKNKMIFNNNKSLKKYSFFVYFTLLTIFITIGLYSIRRHHIFIKTEQQTLKERAQITTSILTLTINSQVNKSIVSKDKLRAALENIIDYTKIDGIAVYSSKGYSIINVGEKIGLAKQLNPKNKVSWLSDRVVYYNDLYGGVFSRYRRDREKKHYNNDSRKLEVSEKKKTFDSNKKKEIAALKLSKTKQQSAQKKTINRVKEQKNYRERNVKRSGPPTLSIVNEQEKKVLNFMSTMEYINLLKNKTLPYDDLVKLLCNIIPNPDAQKVAKSLQDKQLSFFVIREALNDYFKEKYRKKLATFRLGKIAIALPIGEYNTTIRNNWISLIWFNIFFFIGLLTLAFLWRFFIRIAELKISLTLSQEQMNSLKDMNMTAAGLVHETKNPLGVVRGMAQLITAKKYIPHEDQDLLNKIIEETDRVTSRLNQFLSYSKPREINLEKIELSLLIKDVFTILEYDCEDKNITLCSDIEKDIEIINADSEMLRQIIFNLLLNALQAVAPNTGKICLKVFRQNDNNVIIEVIDNGVGIDKSIREDIFRPYFTGNESGTGLGLSIVKQLCLLHNWQLTLVNNNSNNTNEQQTGATFRISGIMR